MVEDLENEGTLIRIDRERCIGCLECIDTCPQTRNTEFPVYEKGEDGFPRVANHDSCIGCLSCEAGCRAEAISVEAPGSKDRVSIAGIRAQLKCRAMF